MLRWIVVHTGARPGAPLPEERKTLGLPEFDLVPKGRCSTPAQVLEAVRDADAALCYGEPYTTEVFAGAPRLKLVVRYGVGVDTIDLEAATEHGVIVAHYPDFCIHEVANHALVLMLACAKKVLLLDHTLREGGWAATREVRVSIGPIHGETLGLVAFGNIARAFAQRARAMDMEVIAYDPYVDPAVFAEAGVESVDLPELLARSDYVSCHLPLNTETKGIINAEFFGQMKPSAYFVNTGRGAVVVEADLISALREGRIRGAGLDVFEHEPIGPEHPLCSMENVVLTSHTASFADETYAARDRRVGRTVRDVLRGGLPEFVANPAVLSRRRR